MYRKIIALLLTLLFLSVLAPERAGAFTDRWGHLNPVGRASALLDIAYGGGVWVAVGKLGSVVTSTDGIA